MHVFENIIRLYAPFVCLGCGVEADRLVCVSCTSAVPPVPSRCYRCKAVSRDFAVCEQCRANTSLRHLYVAVQYQEGLSKELLHAAKYERAIRGLDEIAEWMTPLLLGVPRDAVLVHVPTATRRVRQRGYDQAGYITRILARLLERPQACYLARLGQEHQVGSGRTERLRHLRGGFRVLKADEVVGKHILLVDDVITTGATLETAARVLRKAGARQVDAVVFAQP